MKWCRADHTLNVSLHSGVRMPHCWCVYLSLKFWEVIILSLNIFFIFPLNSFSHSRDSQLTASSSYQPSLVGPSKVRSWRKGPSRAHSVSDIISEPVGCCNLQQWTWSLSKSFSCTEQLNKWLCHSLAHRSSDWMKFWQKSNLLSCQILIRTLTYFLMWWGCTWIQKK